MLKTIIKVTEQFGRGVYADQNITAGQWIECAEILALNTADTVQVNNTDLKCYTFTLDETSDCLVLGNGELYNHSDNPNVEYKLINLNGRNQMVFKALKDITNGDQLLIDYNGDGPAHANYCVNLIK